MQLSGSACHLLIYNNPIVSNKLREIDIAFLEKIEYFCTNFQDLNSMSEELLRTIKPNYKMSRNKKQNNSQQKSATELMIAYRMNNQANERSFGTNRTNIIDFRKFLSESNIPDTIESMTKDIAARYAEWLKRQNISLNTANQRIRALATNLKNLTTILDLDFTYPLPAKLPLLKETITGDECEDYGVALKEYQIEKLISLTNLTDEEAAARDMFCLQCWTGVRVCDIPQLLSSSNIRDIDGNPFPIFLPIKTKNSRKLRDTIPLSAIYPDAINLVNRYKDNPPKFINSRKNTYNELIRAVCRIAAFNEVISKTKETGKGKTTEGKKLWEVVTYHVGCHTFTTNCKKRGIPEDKIIGITGHATTTQIKKTYDNTEVEDNARLLFGYISVEQKAGEITTKSPQQSTIHPIASAVSVLLEAAVQLRFPIGETKGQTDLLSLSKFMHDKQVEIQSKMGIKAYTNIKYALQFGKTLPEQDLLNRFFAMSQLNWKERPIRAVNFEAAIKFWEAIDSTKGQSFEKENG